MLMMQGALLRVCLTSLLLLFLQSIPAKAAPVATFAIKSQVPPVARINQGFSFTFAPTTFTGGLSNLSYSLVNAPSWLQLNAATKTLSGTPTWSETGPVNFQLVATDSTGDTYMPVTFIVSNEQGPQVNPGISSALLLGIEPENPKVFTFYPGSEVSVSVNGSTFTKTDAGTQYYAVCGDNTPLPSWLIFDSDSLSFSGNIPPSTSPTELPQLYSIRVIATNIPGFAQAVYRLQMAINLHQLRFNSTSIMISIFPGQVINVDLMNELLLDSHAVNSSMISKVEALIPDWLNLDNSSLVLSGTAPMNVEAALFDVSITDVYDDVANATIVMSTSKTGRLLSSSIPKIVAIIGDQLSFTLPSKIFLQTGFKTSVDLGNCSSWMKYDADSLSFSGLVPSSESPKTQYINLTVSNGQDMDWEEIPVVLSSPQVTPTATTPSVPTNTVIYPSPWQSWVPPDESTTIGGNLKLVAAGVISGVTIFGILLLVVLRFTIKPKPRIPALTGPERNAEPTIFNYAPGSTDQILDRQNSAFGNYPLASNLVNPRYFNRRFYGLSRFPAFNHSDRRQSAALDSSLPAGNGDTSRGKGFRPVRRPSQTHLKATNDKDNLENINRPTAPASKIMSIKDLRLQAESRRVGQAKEESGTIRTVPKLPTPSEFPSPISSPCTKMETFVRGRAASGVPSSLFSSQAAARNVEKDMIEMVDAPQHKSTSVPLASRISEDSITHPNYPKWSSTSLKSLSAIRSAPDTGSSDVKADRGSAQSGIIQNPFDDSANASVESLKSSSSAIGDQVSNGAYEWDFAGFDQNRGLQSQQSSTRNIRDITAPVPANPVKETPVKELRKSELESLFNRGVSSRGIVSTTGPNPRSQSSSSTAPLPARNIAPSGTGIGYGIAQEQRSSSPGSNTVDPFNRPDRKDVKRTYKAFP